MICPVCHTKNIRDAHAECCIQCGSDLDVHRLLNIVGEDIQMNHKTTEHDSAPSKQNSKLFLFSQIIPSILLLILALFGLFIGMRFLDFLDKAERHKVSTSDKWSETGFQQLQLMNTIIKQELDLIIKQNNDNHALRTQMDALILQKSQPKKNNVSSLPSIREALS